MDLCVKTPAGSDLSKKPNPDPEPGFQDGASTVFPLYLPVGEVGYLFIINFFYILNEYYPDGIHLK